MGAASRAPRMHDAFAVVAPGFEDVAADEMRALGLEAVRQEPGGVAFRASDDGLVAANLGLRVASRIVVRVAEFRARAFAELERHANAVPWGEFVRAGAPAAFRVTCRKSRLYHSDAVAERLGRAVVARMTGASVVRARADDAAPRGPDAQLFVVRVANDVCTISADASGELLHRRGYRLATAKAPIRETIAAGCLLALGYDGHAPLVDPMCGAGTIPIEAALIARALPPGRHRSFACEAWPGFGGSPPTAGSGALPRAPATIVGSDRDAGAIEAATANVQRAHVAGDVTLATCALSAIEPPETPGLLIANPPYGARVGEVKALRNLYAQFGNVARRKFPGWRVALISANRQLEAQTGLPFEEVLRFSNGGIKVRLVAT